MKNSSKKKFWFWSIGILLLLIGLWHLVTNLYREEEKQLRSQLRECVIEKFPEQTSQFFETFGLFYFSTDRKNPKAAHLSRKSVVLVHGLDDPGKVWQNLAPALIGKKFNVWLMHYPNDQPIVASTRLHGVPHLTVEGTHLSMIRNITQDSQRTPPAVPIIVDRLRKEE